MENFLVRERVRAVTYQLLAKCYKLQPTLKEDKIIDNLYEVLSLVSDEAANYAKAMKVEIDNNNNIDEMKFDFLSLFVGPKTLLAPPYGSVYMEERGQIMGVSTQDAMRIYHQAGLKKSEDFKEPPDHIRVELEFMSTLIQQTIEACEKSEWAEAEKKIELQVEFLSKHLAGWIKPFANNIISNAKTEFYKNLAKATESFIRQEYTEDSIAMKEEFKELTEII
ncbi:TorD/DmsD family molecular chaperone [Alkaliphilus oremlandii]|uniref:Cytoplasmic chaperone TorD family protein n=1 Tax=Alkaliphilus oremlandii (strain OhILAs) TaxID=350688 RepID=A8MGV0_ALKOO|nr:molecular chaperone TorD family protein [Alkaliphilus oremlandii]ABW18644.1 cytoplasmic chaperone TorD family protein [Alkaliphilus oremlandii OhILAs]